MKQSVTPLRPEALPPSRSALPLVLALSTALVAGAIGGFVMRSVLPGEVEVRVEQRIVVPASVPYWVSRLILDRPDPVPCIKNDASPAELKLLNNKPL